MRYPYKNFVYLSSIIGLPVTEKTGGKKIGYVRDIAANLGSSYPRITGLIISGRFSRKTSYVPWKSVIGYEEDLLITVNGSSSSSKVKIEDEILLGETFLDKQIVDISGSKVVRVNDLHLVREDLKLWLVHIDVGFKGFLRRLGWLRGVEFLVQWLFTYNLKDKFIPWNYVQPVTTTNVYGSISLKVPQSRISEMHPADLADVLEDLGTEERTMLFKTLDTESAAETLEELPLKIQKHLVKELSDEQFAGILEEMAMDEVVDLIDELPRERVNAIFSLLHEEKVKEIRALLNYSDRTAGGLMNTEFLIVPQDMTLGNVLKKIKEEHDRAESIYYIYVEDDRERLAGVTTIRQILITDPSTRISDVMHKNVIKVEITTDIDAVADIFIKYDFVLVPVVDDNGIIVGIITIKDAFEAVFPKIISEPEEHI